MDGKGCPYGIPFFLNGPTSGGSFSTIACRLFDMGSATRSSTSTGPGGGRAAVEFALAVDSLVPI